MTRVVIFIDGANFHYGLRGIKKGYSDFNIDFSKFSEELVGKRTHIATYYYIASLNKSVNPGLWARQQAFFSRVVKDKRIKVIKLGRQKVTNANGELVYKIKGDDAYLVADMVHYAHLDKYDTAILISGDYDLFPAVLKAKEVGKDVEYWYFKDRKNERLMRLCSSCNEITKKIVNRSFYREPMCIGDVPQVKEALKNAGVETSIG